MSIHLRYSEIFFSFSILLGLQSILKDTLDRGETKAGNKVKVGCRDRDATSPVSKPLLGYSFEREIEDRWISAITTDAGRDVEVCNLELRSFQI